MIFLATLIQLRRALRPDGVFLAAAFAGDSFMELRRSFIAAESEMTGAPAHVSRPRRYSRAGAPFCSARASRFRSPILIG